jgi:hypothetical protein
MKNVDDVASEFHTTQQTAITRRISLKRKRMKTGDFYYGRQRFQ